MFLYMPSVLDLLRFTHNQKAAFAIWCFDLTIVFQPGMLNWPAFFLEEIENLYAELTSSLLAATSSAFKTESKNVSHLYN